MKPRLKRFNQNHFLLGLILVVAFVVRLWGIGFGLPFTNVRHDESLLVDSAMRFGTGDLNPHRFLYPTLYTYMLFGLYSIYYLLGALVGVFESVSSFTVGFFLDPSYFYLIARLVSVIAGVFTVYVTYRLAKKLFDDKVALLSSVFLGFAYLHVRESHFGKVDVLMTLLVMVSLWFIFKSYKSNKLRNYILSGVFAGLAASTKYPGGLVLVPMVLVNLLKILEQKKLGFSSFFNRNFLGFGGAFSLLFVVGMPFALLDFPTFFSYLSWIYRFSAKPWFDVWVGRGWEFHLGVSLFYGLGWLFLLCSVLGMLLQFRKNFRQSLILFSFPLVYFILIGVAFTAVVRFAVPLVPFLSIAAAVLITDLGRVVGRLESSLGKVFLFSASLMVILPSFFRSVSFDRLISRRDSRLLAKEWIIENLEGGSSMYQVGTWLGKIQLPLSIDELNMQKMVLEETVEDGQLGKLRLEIVKKRIKKQRNEGVDGFKQWLYDDQVDVFRFGDQVKDSLPRYVVVYSTPLELDALMDPVSTGIEKLLGKFYVAVKSFEVIDIEDETHVFDPQDAFYVPFAGFFGVERPGPNIKIFKKVDSEG